MIDIVSLVSTGLAFFVIAASPGPANISNAAIAMSCGRNISLRYALGLSCGLIFWGIIAASGLGALLQSSIYLLMALKILGGLYLLWLAAASILSAKNTYLEKVDNGANKNWFLRGLLLNLSNPKTVIAWMAALSLGLNSDNSFYTVGAAFCVCLVVGFLSNVTYSVLFSMSGMMRLYQKAKRWVDGVVAGLLALAGFGLIRSAFAR